MNKPEPLVIASRDCKQAIAEGKRRRRENEIKSAIDAQNNQDRNRDSADAIGAISMAEWKVARTQYGLGRHDRVPGADVF